MTKKLTPKQQLQADYRNTFGSEPDPKMTVSNLTEALATNNSAIVKDKSGNKVWTSSSSGLVSVEGTRNSVKIKDKDGKVKGGTEYFGQAK